jgi:drug/metabolite transporter (DMT)-like permease
MSNKECLLRMAIAMISLGIMTFSFKVMVDHLRHTIFEDIYGRGLIFFLCATFYYWRNKNEGNSVFDIKPHIRFLFLFRVIFISLAYIFLYLSIMNTSSFVYVALILCMLYPIFKFMSRYSLVDVSFNIFDSLAFAISLVGMGFLYNGK